MSADTPSIRSVPPIHHRRSVRDLERAVWLRPRDIAEIYGIPTSTLHELCTEKRGGRILPSKLIPSKNGRKGIRLVRREDMDAYLEHFNESRGEPAV